MQKSSSIALGALSLVVVAVLITAGGARHAPPAPVASAQLPSLPPPPVASWLPVTAPSMSVSPLSLLEKIPLPRALPSSAPRAVRVGVVLVHHCQAQFAPDNCRQRDDALALAKTLAELAAKDFKEAVRRGDPGSTEDAGEIGQSILEPGPEAEVFSLAVGAVSGPIDTPRGFWIAKRIK